MQKLSSRSRDMDERVRAIEKVQPDAVACPSDSVADSTAATKKAVVDDITTTLQVLASDMGCEWTQHKSLAHTHMAAVVSVLATLTERLDSDLQVEQAPDANEEFTTGTQSNDSLQQDDQSKGVEVTGLLHRVQCIVRFSYTCILLLICTLMFVAGTAESLGEAFMQLDRYLVAEDTTLQTLFQKFGAEKESASISRSNCAQLIADTLGVEQPATALLLDHLADDSGNIPVQNVQFELESARRKAAERHANKSTGDTPTVAGKAGQGDMRVMLSRLQVQLRQQVRQQRRQHQECQRGLRQVGDKVEDYVRMQERCQQQQQQQHEKQQQQHEQHERRLDDHDQVITRQHQEWEQKHEQFQGHHHQQTVNMTRDIHSLRAMAEAAQHAVPGSRPCLTLLHPLNATHE